MNFRGNALKNYLRAIRQQRRRHTPKKYIRERQGNIISLSVPLIKREAWEDACQLAKSVRDTGAKYDKGRVINMCNLCSDKGFHVDYVYNEMKGEDDLSDEEMRDKICTTIVEELVDLSYLPEDELEARLYVSDDNEYDAMREHYEYIYKLDNRIRFFRRIIFCAAMAFMFILGIIVYNIFI